MNAVLSRPGQTAHLPHTLSHTLLTDPDGQTTETFGLNKESTTVSAKQLELRGYQVARLGTTFPVMTAISLGLGLGPTEQTRFYPISKSAFAAGDIDAAFAEVRATMSAND